MRRKGLFVAAGLVCLLPVMTNAAKTQTGKTQYPHICGVEGAPEITQNGKALGTGPKDKIEDKVLKEKVLVKTDSAAKVCIELEEGLKLNIFGDSQVFVPAIDWETGRVEELELVSGKMRVIHAAPAKGARLETQLSRQDLPKGEFIFEFLPAEASLRATVLSGELPFRGLENEVTSTLGPGDTQAFLGEIQDHKIQYDVMLGGRQVARGQLGTKTKLAEADLKKLVAYFEIKAPPKKKTAPKKSETLSSKSVATGNLCKKPSGGFNDCLYRCVGNPKGKKECDIENPKVSCERQRCLASGDWGDSFVYAKSKSPCEAADLVKACDY